MQSGGHAVAAVRLAGEGTTTVIPPFDAVYKQERLAVTRVAFLFVRSNPVAEELAQEAFVRLYERFSSIRNPAAFLRTAVARLALTWLRRQGMEHERLAVAAGRDRDRDQEPSGAPEMDEVWEALGRLRPEQRVVLVLRFYEDLSHKRIADVLGCSVGTARSRAHRALADLRRELNR